MNEEDFLKLVDETLTEGWRLHIEHVTKTTAFNLRWGHVFDGDGSDNKTQCKKPTSSAVSTETRTPREMTLHFQYR
jgi:hypothetical protein